MDSESSSITIHHEKLKRRQDSFQEAFQIYESFELNSVSSSPLLSAQVSQSEILDQDTLKSDSTLLSGNVVATTSQSIGKSNKKRVAARPNHTPRPPNSFILYRRDKHAEILMKSNTERGLNNNTISRVVADMWKNESSEVKALYATKADEEKRKHSIKYPDYKYQPRKNKKSNAKCHRKPQLHSDSIATIIDPNESLHTPTCYHFPFENPFSSAWSPPHDYDFHSQFLNQPPQTFYEYRSLDDYALNQMEPHFL